MSSVNDGFPMLTAKARGEKHTEYIDAGTLTDAYFMNFELNWPLMNLECGRTRAEAIGIQ